MKSAATSTLRGYPSFQAIMLEILAVFYGRHNINAIALDPMKNLNEMLANAASDKQVTVDMRIAGSQAKKSTITSPLMPTSEHEPRDATSLARRLVRQ